MAVSCKVGSFDISTAAAGNTQAISAVGFQPKLVIFWWSGIVSSVDAAGGGSFYRGMGVAVSSTDRRCVFAQSMDAQTAAACASGHTNVACICVMDDTGTIVGLMDLQSMDADGFTLIIDDAFPAAYRISYLAIGGADITDQKTDVFTTPAVTGNQSVTVGFQPDFVLLMGAQQNLDGQDTNLDSVMCIGAATGAGEEGVWAGAANNGAATMQSLAYCRSSECYGFYVGSVTSMPGHGTFVSMDANGFTINWTELGAAAQGLRIYYLAVKGGQWFVGNLLTKTDTVTDIAESGFGFSPRGAMFFSASRAEDTLDVPTDHCAMSIGAFSTTTERAAHAVMDEDATADSEVARAVEHDEVYINFDTADAVEGLMDVKSVDGDGFTCIMDDADPVASFVFYFAVGDNAGGAAGHPAMRRLGQARFLREIPGLTGIKVN